MTATDELCRMLDERGVEYVLDEEYGEKYPPEKRVTWSCDLAGEDMTVTARDYCININDDGSADYCLDLEFHEVFTPAQAIAATLGDVPRLPHFWTADGTLHIELPKLPESISVRLPDQRDREVGSARVWQYTLGVVDTGVCQTDTDELDSRHVQNVSAYEAGYRDGSIHYELEHCPACKNIADLQEALEENAKLRSELSDAGTCHMEPVKNYQVSEYATSWGCVCSNCGTFHEFTHGEGWKYCPTCRAEVVDG